MGEPLLGYVRNVVVNVISCNNIMLPFRDTESDFGKGSAVDVPLFGSVPNSLF